MENESLKANSRRKQGSDMRVSLSPYRAQAMRAAEVNSGYRGLRFSVEIDDFAGALDAIETIPAGGHDALTATYIWRDEM